MIIIKLDENISKYQIDTKASINGVLFGSVTKIGNGLQVKLPEKIKIPKDSTFQLKTISISGLKRLSVHLGDSVEDILYDTDSVHVKSLNSGEVTEQEKQIFGEGKKLMLEILNSLDSSD